MGWAPVCGPTTAIPRIGPVPEAPDFYAWGVIHPIVETARLDDIKCLLGVD
jgi:hypothetical protein